MPRSNLPFAGDEYSNCKCGVIAEHNGSWHSLAISMVLLLAHVVLILKLGGLGLLGCSVSLHSHLDSAAPSASLFELMAEQKSLPIECASATDKFGRIKPIDVSKMAIHESDTFGGIKRYTQEDIGCEVIEQCWRSAYPILSRRITNFLVDGAHWLMVSAVVLLAFFLMRKKNAQKS